MGPRRLSLLALCVGIAAAFVLVGGISPQATVPWLLSAPSTILSAGHSETVPAYEGYNGSGWAWCGGHCGSPGELALTFTVTGSARLTGSVSMGAPLSIWVANPVGMEAACSLSTSPPPCAPPPRGPAYLYETNGPVSALDFRQVNFNFGLAGNVIPSGAWTILWINEGSNPVTFSADSAIVVTPTW